MSTGKSQNSGHGIVGQFIRNPVAANLLMLIFLFGGLVVGSNLKSQVFPTISTGVITVTVPYPGATPAEVEEGITRRVEEALLGIDGVKRVQSTAIENMGVITAELRNFANEQIVKEDIQSAVEQIADFPPENAERPIVVAPKPTSGVVTLVVSGSVSEVELRHAAEQLERDLLSQPDISLVALSGDRNYEISIEVSEESLRKFGLSFDEVANAVRGSSLDLAGGSIITESGEILLRTNEKRETGKAFEDIVVRNDIDGSVILLKDVSEIRDGFTRERLFNYYNGTASIFVEIQRAEAEDVLRVKKAVDAYLADYSPPPGITISQFQDQTGILKERINLLVRNAIFGFALVFLFLVLMLDLKLAVWVSVGIITSFLGGSLLFGAAGVTITMVSLFALIVVLGLVVDDAIVIGENIDAERVAGKRGVEAALAGVKGVRSPVLVGVTTTIAAFAPLLLVGGVFGDMVSSIPIVVISVLIISLIEAFFILPTHLAHEGTWSRGPLAMLQDRVSKIFLWISGKLIMPGVKLAVRFRYATIGAAIAFFIICLGLLQTGVVRFIFIPQLEGNDISATVTMPEGSPFERTEEVVERMVWALEKVGDDVNKERGENLFSSVAVTIGGERSGGANPLASGGNSASENKGSIQVELVPFGPDRRMSAMEVERRWREYIGSVEGVERMTFSATLGAFGNDIEYELAHQNDQMLVAASAALKTELERITGVNQVDDTFNLGKRQLVFELTPAGVAAGLTPAMIARQVRQAFFGEEVQRIQRGREEVKVFVRYPESARRSLQVLNDFRVRLLDGSSIPLFTVAEVQESRAYSSINRIDGRRVVTVKADVDEALNTPNNANRLIVSEIMPELENRFPGLRWEIAGASRDQAEDLASLGQAFMIVLLIIYALVAAQLRSYLQPIAILVSIPLGLAGAILGHGVLGYAMSFASIFGVIALAGVAVNASVVLVDLYNKRREEGADAVTAASESAARRFRPILLTTLTTALGLGPLLLETSPQAKFLIPMGISLGFGILISSFMVMFVTPAMTVVVDDLRTLPGKIMRRKEAEHVSDEG